MQVQQASPVDVSANRARDPSRNTEGRESNIAMLEGRADEQIWRARNGVPRTYVVYPYEEESVYFRVTSFQLLYGPNTGALIIHVFPLSYWVKGECREEVAPPQKGERAPYLPSRVLRGGDFDYSRLPDEQREFLSRWADLILDGVEYYDQMHPRRPSRRRDK
jgi:hypothetical protein